MEIVHHHQEHTQYVCVFQNWRAGVNVKSMGVLFEAFGINTIAKTPLTAAQTSPTTNIGKFPPPNASSIGPLVNETKICIAFLTCYIVGSCS